MYAVAISVSGRNSCGTDFRRLVSASKLYFGSVRGHTLACTFGNFEYPWVKNNTVGQFLVVSKTGDALATSKSHCTLESRARLVLRGSGTRDI